MADEPRDPLDDAALAAAFRSARTPSGDHLSEAEWERLACGEMTAAERDRALAHILHCAECTAIHRSLLELRRGAAEIEGLPRQTGGSKTRWTIYGGLATAAAIVAAVLINQPTRVDPNAVTRSSGDNGVVVADTPRAGEPLANRRFSWRPVAGADSYELRISTQDGVRVFTSRRDETSAVLPGDVELSEGTYYWRVLAFKGDAEVAASPLIPFKATSRGR